MNIPSISRLSRVSTYATDTPAPTAIVRQSAAAQGVEIDKITLQPRQQRFPWMNRLSQAAVNERTDFAAAPILGEHVDKWA